MELNPQRRRQARLRCTRCDLVCRAGYACSEGPCEPDDIDREAVVGQYTHPSHDWEPVEDVSYRTIWFDQAITQEDVDE